ncbi:MAG: hypothetical protein KGO81_06040 [Bacteroidota bacterium]|nr:hypothetical protein [Bacteroidota bacterium]
MRNANDFFGSHNGTVHYFRHTLSHFLYTDAVNELATECGAYWLIDLIISHQCNPLVMAESFQVWQLKRVEKNAFYILCTDGNDNKVTSQDIPYSDFPFDTVTIWCIDGILLFPSEY